MRALLAATMLAVVIGAIGNVDAQSSRDTQRKLERIKRELADVAAERRRIEGQRGAASTQLRAVDEQLGHSGRVLSETESSLARQQASLAQLQQRRDALQSTLGARRAELATLLRSAYAVGTAAPLKLMLAQDRVADANRVLTWHRYLQRERLQRIAELTAQLRELDALERQIVQQRSALDAARQQQREQLAQLQRDRSTRAQTVAQLDQRYRDRRSREQALGSDAKSLERLLAQLRIAAAREAERRTAAARAARSASKPGSKPGNKPGSSGKPRPAAPVIANAAPIQVGGLGWPVSGTLLASYGGTLPGGGTSSGLLIGANTGATVKAVANGKVVFADWMNGYGLILIIDHGNGYMSLYAHNEALLRDAGDDVRRGDPVASVGNSGNQSRPGLYFELRRNGQPVNPGTWLQQR
jgi:septal ring factor EnvC (AmiA/AmiB activator)